MKILYAKYDKTLIPALPRVQFSGRTILILTEAEAEKAVNYLLEQPLLGFDTETRPIFRRGQMNKVALMQVSTDDTCFLFRLNRIGLCPPVVRLLETPGVLKIGLSWHDDIAALHRGGGEFTPRGFIDLQNHMAEIGVQDIGLAKLYANLFGERISKRQQLSNWEADTLTPQQQSYAATDAWACVMLYKEYLRLKQSGDYRLVEPELKSEAAFNAL